ncbi:hypothetical protein ACSSS7_005837 [Eimeria intestinalis]
MTRRRFPPQRPLRALVLLQWGVAILSLVVELVPLSAVAAAAGVPSGGAGGAPTENVPRRAKRRKPNGGEEDVPPWRSSDIENETASVNGQIAGASAKTNKNTMRKHLAVATAIGVMLAIFAAAATRQGGLVASDPSSRNVGNRIKKLVALMPDATGLANTVDTFESGVSLKFFKSSLAAADKAHKEARKPEAAKKALKEQQQEIGLHVGDSLSALRFILKTAQDQADFAAKQAQAVLQPSLPAAELVETERAVLKDEFVDAYVIIRECLEKSITRHANYAEEGAKNLKKLPMLTSEDHGLLLGLARRHMKFVKAEGTSCTLTENVMANFAKQLVAAHREYHLNGALESFPKIEELHAAMKAHKEIAIQALHTSLVPGDFVDQLKAFVTAVEGLEKQFAVLSRSFERLRASESTATNVNASADVTIEATKFVDIHRHCAFRLDQVRTFFDGNSAGIKKGAAVFEEASETAYQRSKVDHDHMLHLLKSMLDKKQSMIQGSIAGFSRPLVGPEVIDRVVGGMAKMEQEIKDAMQEARIYAAGLAGVSLASDRQKLQKVTDARIKLAGLRKEADDYSAFFVMLKSMESLIERSIRVHATVEAALKGKGKGSPSKQLTDLIKKFKAGATMRIKQLGDYRRGRV